MFKTVREREINDATKQAESLANDGRQLEDKLLEIREAVQVLIRQVPPEALEVLSTPEKGKSLLPNEEEKEEVMNGKIELPAVASSTK